MYSLQLPSGEICYFEQPHVIAVMGPTASGKSALALALAKHYNGEIISADSAQVYRGIDIGTAKPTSKERAEVPHHLIDIKELEEDFSLAEFQRLASVLVKEIAQRGHLPIIAGGTGLYIRGFLEGYTLIEVPPDMELRSRLEARELANLLEEVDRLDPDTGQTIDRCNKRRVVRALEVMLQTGRRFSECSRRVPPPLKSLKIGLNWDRQILCSRIDKRLQAMINEGWMEEVRDLWEKGKESCLRRLRILGYPEMLDAVNGKISAQEAAELVRLATRRFAKRQATWLRAEPNLYRLDCSEGSSSNLYDATEAALLHFLGNERNLR